MCIYMCVFLRVLMLNNVCVCVGGDGLVEKNESLRARCVIPLATVQMHLPATVGDYTGKLLVTC
jgi:hypothetical protein